MISGTEEESERPVQLVWQQGADAPHPFSALTGTAVAHGDAAYFSCNHEIYSLTEPDFKWVLLPWCKYRLFGMAVVNSKLTTIGGCEDASGTETNVITSLTSRVLAGKHWEEAFFPMPTKRTRPAAVSTDTHLVVSGGWESDHARKVEVLNLKTLQWSSACSLSQHAYFPQMVLCGGLVYVSLHKFILACSLEKLLKSCSAGTDKNVWTRVSDTQQCSISLVTLRGNLLALGGSDELSIAPKTADILCYEKELSNWRVTGEMPFLRFRVLTAAIESSNQVIVVGGKKEHSLNFKAHDTYIGSSEQNPFVVIS